MFKNCVSKALEECSRDIYGSISRVIEARRNLFHTIIEVSFDIFVEDPRNKYNLSNKNIFLFHKMCHLHNYAVVNSDRYAPVFEFIHCCRIINSM